MTRVLFRTFGHITSLTGGNQMEVEFSGSTIEDLLNELVRRFGPPMKGVLYPRDGSLSELLFVLVNGRNITYLDNTRTRLKDGDVVSVLPVTAGG